MPFVRLGKEREALHSSGEQYRKAVALFLERRGMARIMDSSVEGQFEDIILYDQGNIRVLVECKDHPVSPNAQDFLIPFGWQLSRFAKLPASDRFRFIYCAREISDHDLLNRVFTNYDLKAALGIVERAVKMLERSSNEAFRAAAGELKQIPEETVSSFIAKSEVIEADIFALVRFAHEDPRLMHATISRLLIPAKEIAESLSTMGKVQEVSETLACNLFEVRSMPETVCIAGTEYRTAKEIVEELGPKVRPFMLKEGRIFTFSDLRDSKNTLTKVLASDRVWNKRLADAFHSPGRALWLTELMNVSLSKYLRTLGMARYENDTYYFPSSSGKELDCRWHTGLKMITRVVTRRKRRFWKHYAVNVRFRFIGSSPYLTVNPSFFFSNEGVTRVNSRLTTMLSSGAWARHGNLRLLNDVRFWMNMISNTKAFITIETGGKPIEVDSQPVRYQVQFGVENDSQPHLMVPIPKPVCGKYWRVPTEQTKLDEDLYFDERDTTAANDAEEDFDERH